MGQIGSLSVGSKHKAPAGAVTPAVNAELVNEAVQNVQPVVEAAAAQLDKAINNDTEAEGAETHPPDQSPAPVDEPLVDKEAQRQRQEEEQRAKEEADKQELHAIDSISQALDEHNKAQQLAIEEAEEMAAAAAEAAAEVEREAEKTRAELAYLVQMADNPPPQTAIIPDVSFDYNKQPTTFDAAFQQQQQIQPPVQRVPSMPQQPLASAAPVVQESYGLPTSNYGLPSNTYSFAPSTNAPLRTATFGGMSAPVTETQSFGRSTTLTGSMGTFGMPTNQMTTGTPQSSFGRNTGAMLLQQANSMGNGAAPLNNDQSLSRTSTGLSSATFAPMRTTTGLSQADAQQPFGRTVTFGGTQEQTFSRVSTGIPSDQQYQQQPQVYEQQAPLARNVTVSSFEQLPFGRTATGLPTATDFAQMQQQQQQQQPIARVTTAAAWEQLPFGRTATGIPIDQQVQQQQQAQQEAPIARVTTAAAWEQLPFGRTTTAAPVQAQAPAVEQQVAPAPAPEPIAAVQETTPAPSNPVESQPPVQRTGTTSAAAPQLFEEVKVAAPVTTAYRFPEDKFRLMMSIPEIMSSAEGVEDFFNQVAQDTALLDSDEVYEFMKGIWEQVFPDQPI